MIKLICPECGSYKITYCCLPESKQTRINDDLFECESCETEFYYSEAGWEVE